MMEPSDPNAGRDNRRGSGISLQTLIIASAASAAASFAIARIWGSGTLIGAAAAPVIVALLSEFLRRPVQTVAATAKRVPAGHVMPAVRERTIATPGDASHAQENPTRVAADPPGRPRRCHVEPPAAVTPVVDGGTVAHAETTNTWRPRWRLAVLTGVVAFAIVVGVYTVPDLLAGRSITGNGQPTTFFGGSVNVKKKASPVTTVTTTAPATVTKTATTTTPTTKTTTTPTTKTTTTKADHYE